MLLVVSSFLVHWDSYLLGKYFSGPEILNLITFMKWVCPRSLKMTSFLRYPSASTAHLTYSGGVIFRIHCVSPWDRCVLWNVGFDEPHLVIPFFLPKKGYKLVLWAMASYHFMVICISSSWYAVYMHDDILFWATFANSLDEQCISLSFGLVESSASKCQEFI